MEEQEKDERNDGKSLHLAANVQGIDQVFNEVANSVDKAISHVDEALKSIPVLRHIPHYDNVVHAAATKIQKVFRGWLARKKYNIILSYGSTYQGSKEVSWKKAAWMECVDEEGNVYYYNQDTGESTWSLPNEIRLSFDLSRPPLRDTKDQNLEEINSTSTGEEIIKEQELFFIEDLRAAFMRVQEKRDDVLSKEAQIEKEVSHLKNSNSSLQLDLEEKVKAIAHLESSDNFLKRNVAESEKIIADLKQQLNLNRMEHELHVNDKESKIFDISNEHNNLKTKFQEKILEIEKTENFVKDQQKLLNKAHEELKEAKSDNIELQNKFDHVLQERKTMLAQTNTANVSEITQRFETLNDQNKQLLFEKTKINNIIKDVVKLPVETVLRPAHISVENNNEKLRLVINYIEGEDKISERNQKQAQQLEEKESAIKVLEKQTKSAESEIKRLNKEKQDVQIQLDGKQQMLIKMEKEINKKEFMITEEQEKQQKFQKKISQLSAELVRTQEMLNEKSENLLAKESLLKDLKTKLGDLEAENQQIKRYSKEAVDKSKTALDLALRENERMKRQSTETMKEAQRTQMEASRAVKLSNDIESEIKIQTKVIKTKDTQIQFYIDQQLGYKATIENMFENIKQLKIEANVSKFTLQYELSRFEETLKSFATVFSKRFTKKHEIAEMTRVRVYARIRPIRFDPWTVKIDSGHNLEPAIDIIDEDKIKLKRNTCQRWKLWKNLNGVSKGTSREMYEKMEIHSLIDEVSSEGITACIFCYGQTKTGKTHTLYGNVLDPGIIALSLEYIEQNNLKVDISATEVLGSDIQSVGLNDSTELHKNEEKQKIFKTNSNHVSMVYTFSFGEKGGRLHFVDLPRSDRIAKASNKIRIRMAKTALKTNESVRHWIWAHTREHRPPNYIVDAALTKFLESEKPSKGLTVIFIAHISPEPKDADESCCSLNFASSILQKTGNH